MMIWSLGVPSKDINYDRDTIELDRERDPGTV